MARSTTTFEQGRKKTGGRKKGTPNKTNLGVKERLENEGIDVVSELANTYKQTSEDVIKLSILKELMRYCYPQLKSTDLNVNQDKGFTIVVADEKHKRMLDEL